MNQVDTWDPRVCYAKLSFIQLIFINQFHCPWSITSRFHEQLWGRYILWPNSVWIISAGISQRKKLIDTIDTDLLMKFHQHFDVVAHSIDQHLNFIFVELKLVLFFVFIYLYQLCVCFFSHSLKTIFWIECTNCHKNGIFNNAHFTIDHVLFYSGGFKLARYDRIL